MTTYAGTAHARGNSTVMAVALPVERRLTETGILLHSGAMELLSNYLLMAPESLRYCYASHWEHL